VVTRLVSRSSVALLLAVAALAAACGGGGPTSRPIPAAARPWMLLVTLDTTRADAVGPEAAGIRTPGFDAAAARGLRFRQAYAAVPETLPSHVSMMTGVYPAAHGVHENARPVPAGQPLVAERLHQAGYRTAAFVSSFILAHRFGLARGFDSYDDLLPPNGNERSAKATTDAALAFLDRPAGGTAGQPLFIWVHYFEPHAPYTPPEPFATQCKGHPYLGEVAAMDAELDRLVRAFEQKSAGNGALVIVGDHGEGLGEHGEAQHGNLLYQATMHVPLVIAGPGVRPGVADRPISTRRVFNTLLDWAGLGAAGSLRGADGEVVVGEAMKPFLEYGWQPQVMTVDGPHKAILAGRVEIFDVLADPAESRDLAGDDRLRSRLPAALRDYPAPSPTASRPPDTLDEDARRSLASLGYVSSSAAPEVRKGAPRPADMAALFEVVEKAGGLFVAERYADAIPLFQQVLARDPFNLDAALRLATACSALGRDAQAMAMFKRAGEIAPSSPDVRAYLALHLARGKNWQEAVPLLERAAAETPDRLPVVEALSIVRERQGRLEEAGNLREKVYSLRTPSRGELVALGRLEMEAGRTAPAIAAFEKARALDASRFAQDLELGLLYLDARQFPEARDALDRVRPTHPDYAMALFKRAQVSVLLKEPDSAARIAAAREHASAETRPLIEREKLFK
jgi:choline-sulfatase